MYLGVSGDHPKSAGTSRGPVKEQKPFELLLSLLGSGTLAVVPPAHLAGPAGMTTIIDFSKPTQLHR